MPDSHLPRKFELRLSISHFKTGKFATIVELPMSQFVSSVDAEHTLHMTCVLVDETYTTYDIWHWPVKFSAVPVDISKKDTVANL